MNQFKSGFSYNKEIAQAIGLPKTQSTTLKFPLAAAGIEVVDSGIGKTTLLHVFFDSKTDVRLPTDNMMMSYGPRVNSLPYGFIRKIESSAAKKFMAAQTKKLANLVMLRHGQSKLKSEVNIFKDEKASYSSMPLDGYIREFLPGITWLSISINAELLSNDNYKILNLYIEKGSTPEGMIANGLINPKQLVEIEVPSSLVIGMRETMKRVADPKQNPKVPFRKKEFDIY